MDNDPRLEFVARTEDFLKRNRGRLVFRALKAFTRCGERELDFMIRKIYAGSIESSQNVTEGATKKCLGVLLLPLNCLLKKKLRWRPAPKARYQLEVPDEEYFRTRFSVMFEMLEGVKRLTPKDGRRINGYETTEPADASVSFPTLLRLFLTSALVFIPLNIFCRRSGIDIRRTYRNALSVFTYFDGYFRRYPSENFITYADDGNHPCRYIAFRQNSSGRLMAVQNGERGLHPSWAFGMLDDYFVFGEHYADLVKMAGYRADKVHAVGSLTLNSYFELLKGVERDGAFDIIYIDNGTLCPPLYGGLSEEVARSEETTLAFLGRLKASNRGLRVAYQLRPYPEKSPERDHTIEVLRRCFKEEIELLDNTGRGESYSNIKRSRLVITFQSTMGAEAFMLGTRALFVNYSGHPNETLSGDERFQIEGRPDYGVFEKKVLGLLSTELEEVPELALQRHAAFDGRVQEAIAGIINGGRA